jgi:hypothetical protein
MRYKIPVVILLALGGYGYSQYERRAHLEVAESPAPRATASPGSGVAAPGAMYKCDGRTYCSQMTSCAEATYFLQNCPGTKMDGNNDGIPCEKQWCN